MPSRLILSYSCLQHNYWFLIQNVNYQYKQNCKCQIFRSNSSNSDDMESCVAVQRSQGGQSRHLHWPHPLRIARKLGAGRRQKDNEASVEKIEDVHGGRIRSGEIRTRDRSFRRGSSRRPEPDDDPSSHGVPRRAAVGRHRDRSTDHLRGRHSHEKQKQVRIEICKNPTALRTIGKCDFYNDVHAATTTTSTTTSAAAAATTTSYLWTDSGHGFTSVQQHWKTW